MIELLKQKTQRLPAEERLRLFIGHLQLARRELDHMIRDNEMAGDDDKAAGIAAGHQIVGDVVDYWFPDIANEVADSVDMAHALHRARMRRDLPF